MSVCLCLTASIRPITVLLILEPRRVVQAPELTLLVMPSSRPVGLELSNWHAGESRSP